MQWLVTWDSRHIHRRAKGCIEFYNRMYAWLVDWLVLFSEIAIILVIIVCDCKEYEWSPCSGVYQPHARQHPHESLLNSTLEGQVRSCHMQGHGIQV